MARTHDQRPLVLPTFPSDPKPPTRRLRPAKNGVFASVLVRRAWRTRRRTRWRDAVPRDEMATHHSHVVVARHFGDLFDRERCVQQPSRATDGCHARDSGSRDPCPASATDEMPLQRCTRRRRPPSRRFDRRYWPPWSKRRGLGEAGGGGDVLVCCGQIPTGFRS